ncbi:hypothetical protein ACFZB9_14045 [Kitasatospora sp. NPDC008050]|uniref:hypothetical protein n=1 Tax=Kitasatospora sp. NPDC008050 TaxID=3364021 RepID=UPI0036E6B354
MEWLILMALAYTLGGGVSAGHATAQQHTKTKLAKEPRPIDWTDKGQRAAQSAINTVARAYTWTSGAREGWRKTWPDTKTVISERRAKVKADKAERKAARDHTKTAAGTASGTARGASEPEIIDAEIVEDEPLNTGGPRPPDPETVARAAREAGATAASADATVRIHITTDPPAGTGPTTAPRGGPKPPPASASAAPPRPEPPRLRLVKDTITAPPAATTAPPTAGSGKPAAGVVGPAPAGGTVTAPRSSMTTLPTTATRVTEVTGVVSLMQYLAQLSRWARMEKDDAAAAIARLKQLEVKAEAAYTAAVGAKYDKDTLGRLAAITERLGALRAARQEDLHASDLAESNARQASANVWTRHGGIQEAVDASSVEMAESTTYGD